MKLKLITIIGLVLLLSVIFTISAPDVTIQSDGRLACEVDRSCCMEVTEFVGELCLINISWSDCPDGNYCPEAHYVNDSGFQTYDVLNVYHTWGSDWNMANKDDMDNGLSARPSFRSYFNVHSGYTNPITPRDNYINSWKAMTTGETSSFGNIKIEEEIIVWNTSYFGWKAIKCVDFGADECFTNSTDIRNGVKLSLSGLPLGNISNVSESIYGCDDCFIIEYNDTLSATTYEPKLNISFVIVIHPKPDHINVSQFGKSSIFNVYYNLSQNQIINITYGTFRKPHHNDLAEWVGNVTNYLDKEAMIRNWTRDFYQAFNYPSGASEQNKTDYYNGILSYAYNSLTCFNRTDTTSNWWLGDRCAVINTPNMVSYYAMWKWDSFNTGLGLISAINISNPNAGWVLNITIGDWLRVWINNSDKYPTVESWKRVILEKSLDNNQQSEGGWALLALNLYNLTKSNGVEVISKDYLCNDVLPNLRSDYQSYNDSDTNNNGLIGDGSGNLGRDATDIMDSSNENTDATNWHILHAISLANIYNICEDIVNRTSMMVDFNFSVSNYDNFWNSSCNENGGCYWNFDSTGDFYNFDETTEDDMATNPFSSCLPLVWGNITPTRAEYLIGDLLRSQFTDPIGDYPYTSISVNHPSYTPTGGSGQTWDGAIWAGVDNFWCLNAIRDAQDRYGFSTLANDEAFLEGKNMKIMGLDEDSTPWGSESWESQNLSVDVTGLWGSNPYGWGGNVPTSALNDYNIFNVLGLFGGDDIEPIITVIYPVNFIDAGSLWTWVNISTNENSNCSYNGTDTGIENMTLFTNTNGLIHSFNFSNGSVLKDYSTYDLYFKCNDSNGNVVSESTNFTIGVEAANINWTDRFDWLNSNQSNEMCILHRGVIASSMYEEIPNCIHSLLNMYESTGDIKYLNNTDRQLDNISKRYTEWGTMDRGDFRYGHMGGAYARYIYEAEKSGDATLQGRGDYYLEFISENISSKISSFFKNFTYNGKNVGMLIENDTSETTRVNPFNQVYGFALMNIYLYNVTLNSTYYDRSLRMALAFNESYSYGNCNYDSNRKCLNTSYRFNYTQSWENYSGTSFGFPPHKEQWQYLPQQTEILYRFWKHGFLENTSTQRMANSVYFDQYLQEGGLDNVLMSRDIGYPQTTFATWNVLYLTHSTYTIPYYSVWNSNISNISIEIIKTVYNTVDDRDSTYTFYQQPYGTVLDPRTDVGSTYTPTFSNVTSDQLMKYISTYLYFEEGEASQSEDFPVPPESTSPSFTNNQNNASTTTFSTSDIQKNITVNDDSNISAVILAWDVTGVFVNITTLNYLGNGNVTAIFNETINNMPLAGGTVNYKFQSNDTLNNINISQTFSFTVQDNTPTNNLRGSISAVILRNGLGVILAIFILISLIAPLMINFSKLPEERWEMEQWIKYYIVSIVIIFLIVILIEQIFNITA